MLKHREHIQKIKRENSIIGQSVKQNIIGENSRKSELSKKMSEIVKKRADFAAGIKVKSQSSNRR